MPRPKQNEHTRDSLIEVGIRHISQFGYHGTGIKQILDELKVPKGSFYNYFNSKEAFVAELLEAERLNQAQRVRVYLDDQQLNPIAKLRAIYGESRRRYAEHQGKQGCLIACVANDLGNTSELCQHAMRRSIKTLNALLADLIHDAQTQNLIASTADPKRLATLMWTAWEGSLIEMKVEGNTDNLTDIIDFMFSDILQVR